MTRFGRSGDRRWQPQSVSISGQLVRFSGKLSLFLLGTLAFLLAGELAFRFYLTHYGSDRQRIMYLYSRQEIAQQAALFRGLPYVNYGLNPAHNDVNSEGYRGAEVAVPKPDGLFRVVALGGSTTYGIYLTAEEAYPAQLQAILRDEYGYEQVEVVNAGVPGYKTWENFLSFALQILDLEPDLIIIYQGFNDVAARMAAPEDYDGLNSATAGIWNFDQESLPVSALYRLIAIRQGWMTDPREMGATFDRVPGQQECEFVPVGEDFKCANLAQTPDDLLDDNPPVYFERNLRSMIAVAQANDVAVLLSTFGYSPHEFDHPGGEIMTTEFRQAGVDEHNRIIRQVGAEMDVPVYDVMAALPDNPALWIDGLHYSAVGTRWLARRYAAFIAEEGYLSR